MRYLLITEKSWHDELFKYLSMRKDEEWIRIKTKDEFTYDRLLNLKPARIFIPHWSYIIEPKIILNFDCVIFHMTDLPYGRGGSPLQNLIVRGLTNTKISAIKATKELDSGPIYLKSDLSLEGTAYQIFSRASKIIQVMIEEIIEKEPTPKVQKGDVVQFKRRSTDDGSISRLESIDRIYDFIRMLDCEGYPNAFLLHKNLRLEFRNATKKANQVKAEVTIRIIEG